MIFTLCGCGWQGFCNAAFKVHWEAAHPDDPMPVPNVSGTYVLASYAAIPEKGKDDSARRNPPKHR